MGLQNRTVSMIFIEIEQSKDNGGLGVRGIEEMNDALLLKWWWRFGTKKNALWRRIVCAKYGMNTNLWLPNMEIKRNVSVIWKEIIQIQSRKPLIFSKFKENIKLSVGDGKFIRFWIDEWVGDRNLSILFPGIFSDHQ